MIRRLLLLALLLPCLATSAPLDRLLHEELLPTTRDALVAEACAAKPIAPETLRPLFRSDRRTPALDATRVAVCAQDEALIPLMMEEFGRAYVGGGASMDPDVFERLLRGLQSFPPGRVRARMAEASYAGIVDAVRDRFVGNQVSNLAADPEHPPLATLRPEQSARLEERARAWFDGLLAHGPVGLQWLQTDSGGAFTLLQTVLHDAMVRELIEHGTAAERAIGEQLRAEQPPLESDPYPQGILVHPVVPVSVPVPPGDWLHEPGPRPTGPGIPLALGALVLLAVWALALRRWPGSRRVLFPVGAVVLVGAGLGLTELLLGLLGVRPLAELRPSFDPNQVSGQLYGPAELEGQPHLVAMQGGHRYHALPRPAPPDRKRVVTLGESSVHGTHYLAEEAFSAVLGEGLEGVDVVNAGVGAALSDEILQAGIESLGWEPDLLVIYLGYNDLTHLPYMARFRGYSPAGMALRRQMGQWRTVRALRGVLPDGVLELGSPRSDAAELEDEDPSDERTLSLIELARENATGNITRLVFAAKDAGVPVLLVSQASHESGCPPEGAGRREVLAMGCYRDELASITRQAARRTGAPWFDAAGVVRAHVQGLPADGVDPWNLLFWDGIHPTREGHALIGQALVEPVRAMLEGGPQAGR